MQTELIERIIHLPIAERIEIIEKISRSVREDLRKKTNENLIENRVKAVDFLRGMARAEKKVPPTDEEVEKDYADYLAEKYK